jgi:hypothetical protein
MAEIENKPKEQATAIPQQEGIQTPVNNQLGNPRPCPKDCRRCSWQQQICCASMLSFQSFEVMNGIIQRLDIQSQRIADLEAKIAAIQNTEAELSSPLPFQGDLFAGQE